MNADVPGSVFRRILIACDFSPCSEVLIPYAASLARKCKATLLLAHVASPEVISVEPPVVLPQLKSANEQMQELELSEQLDGVDHAVLVSEGLPAEALLKLASDNEVDLIMMGTHGRTGFRKLIMGSVAEKVFRNAPCPVMTVGPHVFAEIRREAHITSILCAIGALDRQHPAIQTAATISACHNASLALLHVVPAQMASSVAQDTAVLRSQLLELAPHNLQQQAPIEALVEVGTPSDLIVRIAVERVVDLIVLDALPPAMLTAHLMDTAYRVIVDAPCPVVTVLVTAKDRPTRATSSAL